MFLFNFSFSINKRLKLETILMRKRDKKNCKVKDNLIKYLMKIIIAQLQLQSKTKQCL
jgi:hypothetical protein